MDNSNRYSREIELNPREIVFAQRNVNAEKQRFWNARRHIHKQSLEELREDIKQLGLTQQITVRFWNGIYQLVCGERRLRCLLELLDSNQECYSKTLGQYAPATEVYGKLKVTVEYNLSDKDASKLSHSENAARKDITESDLMIECYELCHLEEDGKRLYTRADVADIVRRSEGWVSQTLSLFSLPERAKGMLENGTLSRTHALYLLKLDTERMDSFLNVLEMTSKALVEEEMARATAEVNSLVEELELVSAEEAIAKKRQNTDTSKISKSKELLQQKLANAQQRRKRAGVPRITPDTMQQIADQIEGSRKGKAIAVSHKQIRKMRNQLRDGNVAYAIRDVELSLKILDMCLGESEDRTIFQVLDRFYGTSQHAKT